MPLFLFPPFPPRPEPVEAPPGAPTQHEATQNEIDYHRDLNQTDWSGNPPNAAVQNEVDYAAELNQTQWT